VTTAATTQPRHPSGEQHTIAYDAATAVVTQVGATLRTLAFDGLDVIDGFAADERAADGRGQVLAPWPNRIAGGRYSFDDVECQAPLNEPARHNAIHGLVRWLDWELLAREGASVELGCSLRPQPGYEWGLDLRVRYALAADGLTVSMHVTNVDGRTAPFGAGFHPYLTLGGNIDRLELTVPAGDRLDGDPDERPVWEPVAGTPWDFSRSRQVSDTQLDKAYGRLLRDEDGTATARITDPDTGNGLELWVDAAYRYLMVYTGDQVGRPERRRRAVAVEPMTCPPGAFRSGVDVVELEPGDSWSGSWGIRPTSRS